MIQNKTEYFLKIRQTPTRNRDSLVMCPIKTQLISLGTCIAHLENKMEMCMLPDFGSKDRKYREIQELKEKIHQLAKAIELEAKTFSCEDKTVQKEVQRHLLDNLRLHLTKFSSIDQKLILRKTIDPPKPEMWAGGLQEVDSEALLVQESIERNQSIKASVYSVTNTLIQLKTALKSQTSLIDTIDSYFDKSNVYLERANKEIERLPGNYCSFKDYAIYGLLYLICILLLMIFVKAHKNKLPWFDSPRISINLKKQPTPTN